MRGASTRHEPTSTVDLGVEQARRPTTLARTTRLKLVSILGWVLLVEESGNPESNNLDHSVRLDDDIPTWHFESGLQSQNMSRPILNNSPDCTTGENV
ncbi:hypothetical protein A2U01_0008258 [Trifolium medium]|uniref:Uncharacterized protein n=1 Tax=Trifolium medium TaxID=97028 RepID=A0A392MK11_9FABA|nr:hypothetical protein [Trifolium medium]